MTSLEHVAEAERVLALVWDGERLRADISGELVAIARLHATLAVATALAGQGASS